MVQRYKHKRGRKNTSVCSKLRLLSHAGNTHTTKPVDYDRSFVSLFIIVTLIIRIQISEFKNRSQQTKSFWNQTTCHVLDRFRKFRSIKFSVWAYHWHHLIKNLVQEFRTKLIAYIKNQNSEVFDVRVSSWYYGFLWI